MANLPVPSRREYACVDAVVAFEAMNLIREKFRVLLVAGAQVRDLPSDMRAAGQHLDRYEFPQRGIFGTAAAIRVMGDSLGSDDNESLLNALIKYADERSDVEIPLVGGAEAEGIRFRLLVEVDDTFKMADLAYSLAKVTRLASGRDLLLRKLVDRIEKGRRGNGGWAVDLSGRGGSDLLATAHAVRALHTAGRAIAGRDVVVLEQGLTGRDASDYVASFVLLVLLMVRRDGLTGRERGWVTELWERLAPETTKSSEANYDYQIGSRTYYVRVPWQVYLLSCALIAQPATRFLAWRRQRLVLAAFEALASTKGFVYPLSGATPSTRTYAVLYDFFDETRLAFARIPLLGVLSRSMNIVTRIVYGRTAGIAAGVASLIFTVVAVRVWLTSGQGSIGDVATNIVAAAVLALFGLAVGRVRR